MPKNKKSQGTSGSDDISGLFERFGAGVDARHYQPFDHPELPQRTAPAEPVPAGPEPAEPAAAEAAAPAPPPLPAPEPAPAAVVAPLRKLRPVEASLPEPAAGDDTPLAKLFQRLLLEGAEVRDAGPLRRLFPR